MSDNVIIAGAGHAAGQVAVSLRQSPEIVLLGSTQPIRISGFMRGPNGLIIKDDPNQPGRLRISRFQVGKDDKRTTVDDTLPSLIRGIHSVGCGYGDVIAVLRRAKDKGRVTWQWLHVEEEGVSKRLSLPG